uniref:Protein RFT1 homolog n=1 Tax=Ascaris lumbricoides TaxID=6252 RepID=A0A0M3HKP9_ASCLU
MYTSLPLSPSLPLDPFPFSSTSLQFSHRISTLNSALGRFHFFFFKAIQLLGRLSGRVGRAERVVYVQNVLHSLICVPLTASFIEQFALSNTVDGFRLLSHSLGIDYCCILYML